MSKPAELSPAVDSCIADVMRKHPGKTPKALAVYFEAVHQELAPLARSLESDCAKLQLALQNVRTLASKHRNEEWAQQMLRLCNDVGVHAGPLRSTANKSGKAAHEPK